MRAVAVWRPVEWSDGFVDEHSLEDLFDVLEAELQMQCSIEEVMPVGHRQYMLVVAGTIDGVRLIPDEPPEPTVMLRIECDVEEPTS